eukprot:CAMPEP_0117012264 /NCGR_PEP_ID=MMETSP0472-20121206/10362_1 /TAXON_ID=693140 ORGANISM="Tiarina fusus, Strain LIS" /NCGR_SAMPLE_ID=MMETSP0472 /ASSEMBLY_ACC=CAM_ASM_000603 /LENGTH=334 /DNA_ID=CAMNT_0004715295 /DNA_START=1620 /DNA_END=2621 /DNA_ORIENTATION=+
MQLAGSLFVVAVIPIVPQIEHLLNLPERSLTKQIELTEKIIELFIEYQIPSDLLAYQGNNEVPCSVKIDKVEKSVEAVYKIIQEEKDAILAERLRQEEIKRLEAEKKEQERLRKQAEKRSEEPLFHRKIDRLLERGERLESLECKSDTLAFQSKSFKLKAKSWNPFSALTSNSSKRFYDSSIELCESSVPNDLMMDCDIIGDSGGEVIGGLPETEEEKIESKSEEEKEIPEIVQNIEMEASKEVDITQIPKKLDSAFENLDPDDAVHSTKIKAGDVWHKKSCSKLGKPVKEKLGSDELDKEKKRTLDLLDCISRSGCLSLTDVDVHVLVGVSHW